MCMVCFLARRIDQSIPQYNSSFEPPGRIVLSEQFTDLPIAGIFNSYSQNSEAKKYMFSPACWFHWTNDIQSYFHLKHVFA